MQLEELARMIKQMRQVQNLYFVSRDRNALNECRDMERRVDRAVAAILSPPQPVLFEDEPAAAALPQVVPERVSDTIAEG